MKKNKLPEWMKVELIKVKREVNGENGKTRYSIEYYERRKIELNEILNPKEREKNKLRYAKKNIQFPIATEKEIERIRKEKRKYENDVREAEKMIFALNKENVGKCNECPYKKDNKCEKKCFIYELINEYKEI